jgi:hypothetical protein
LCKELRFNSPPWLCKTKKKKRKRKKNGT